MTSLERVSNRDVAVGDIIELPEAGELAEVTAATTGTHGEVGVILQQHKSAADGGDEVLHVRTYVLPADGSIRRVRTLI